LEYNVKNKYHILDRAKQRAEWVKYQEQQKQKREEEEEQERIAYAQIDWHDFVVVETVLFSEADDQAELPPPTSLNDLQSASLEQKAMISLNPMRIEEAMPTDLEEPTYYNAYPVQPEPVPAVQPAGPVFPQQPIQPMPVPAAAAAAAQEEEQRVAFQAQQAATPPTGSRNAQQPMRIRSDYVPRAQARRLNNAGPTALCPNCHQQIPVAELDQHMRIELLDPRWKEQRAKAESRSATTNLSTTDVYNNLKRLASQRGDVFDSSVLPGTADPEDEARRKRMATGAPPAPGADGVPGMAHMQPMVGPSGASPHPQNMNVEDQIRHLHERYRQ
jgi:splicing factor 3A subunit 1